MHFKIESKTDLQNNIKNIVKKQLQTLLIELKDEEYSLSKKVHQIRKMCKRQRGLLQIVKPILKDPKNYYEQNNFYKELANQVAGSRDTKVMVDMFELIIKNHNLQRDQFIDIEKSLKTNNHNENFSKKQIDIKLQACTEKIEKKINNIENIEFSTDDIDGLKTGFENTYKKARRYMKRALANSDVEEFHTFRKFAKYHMHHITLLSNRSILPKSRAKELKELTDILGIEHDLTLFESYLIENKKLLPNTKRLITFLHLEQKRLRKNAHKLEKRLFRLTPNILTQYAII